MPDLFGRTLSRRDLAGGREGQGPLDAGALMQSVVKIAFHQQ